MKLKPAQMKSIPMKSVPMISVLFMATAFLLFTACQSGPVIWDDSHPSEELATVRLMSMVIDSYNGIAVKNFEWVKIPAGETRLGGLVIIEHAGVYWRANGMEFTCNLEKGKEYIITGKGENMQWGVSVYEASTYKEATEENKVAFIPFKNQPIFN